MSKTKNVALITGGTGQDGAIYQNFCLTKAMRYTALSAAVEDLSILDLAKIVAKSVC